MTQHQTQKGFTLVELAIVMTIIGLLIGGILKGQELMNNARITSTVAQVKGIEAAVTTFRDAYNAIPGDLGATASTRIPGCNLGCNNSAATSGDGTVGVVAWPTNWATQFAATTGTATHTTPEQETGLFWTHLLMANLLGGVTDEGIRAALANNVASQPWGSVRPAARIGGGFVVGNGNGTVPSASTQPAGTGPVGMLLALVNAPNSPATAAGVSLTPARAGQIDRKMDDGRPAVGNVQQFGGAPGAATCMSATFAYNETLSTNVCGLLIRIQG